MRGKIFTRTGAHLEFSRILRNRAPWRKDRDGALSRHQCGVDVQADRPEGQAKPNAGRGLGGRDRGLGDTQGLAPRPFWLI